MYSFGVDIPFTLFTYESGASLPAIPAQHFVAYLYKDKPSRADARDGAGAIATIYGEVPAPEEDESLSNELSFVIPAISDPDPSSAVATLDYYVAVVFVLQADEEPQLIIKGFQVSRVFGKDKLIGVTLVEIQNVYPDVNRYLTDSEIIAFIALAKREILSRLRGRGIEWSEVHDPTQLADVVLFRSLWYVYSSQIVSAGDRFFILAEKADQTYTSLLREFKVSTSATDSAKAENTTQPTGSVILCR